MAISQVITDFDCRWCPFVFGNLVFQFMVATWIQMSHGWRPSTWPWSIAVPFRRNCKQLLILVALHFARMPPVQCTSMYHLVSIFGYGSKAHDHSWPSGRFLFLSVLLVIGAIRNTQFVNAGVSCWLKVVWFSNLVGTIYRVGTFLN